MTTTNRPSVPAGTIVVGIDGSGSARQALSWAAEQARLERRPLTIAHAVESTLNPRRDLAEAEAVVDLASAAVSEHEPALEVHRVVESVDPRSLMIHLSEHAQTLVVGSHGRGPLRTRLLGSVGIALTRHAHCPVVVHRPTRSGVVRRGVLVGVDRSADAQVVLEHAYRMASLRGLPLSVMHCFYDVAAATVQAHLVQTEHPDLAEHRALVAEVMAGMGEKYPDVHATVAIARGLPDAALVAMAERMHLVVIGAHHGGVASTILFGSVASSVVEHATCPVEVVRS